MNNCFRLSLLVLGLCALLAASFGVRANSALDELATLLERGQTQSAYSLALQQRADYEGDPKFDLYYGIAAVNSGHSAEGVFALERVLAKYPQHDGARLALARGYFQLTEDDRARTEFMTVLSHDPDQRIRNNIHRYLNAIDARQGRYRRHFGGYVQVGVGRDTNINSATDREFVEVDPGFFLDLFVPPEERETDDWFSDISAGLNFDMPVAPALSLLASLDLNQRFHGDNDFDTGLIDGQVGAAWKRGAERFRGTLQLQKYDVDSEEYRRMRALNLDWRHEYSARTQAQAFIQYADFAYDDLDFRDSDMVTVGIGGSHAVPGRYKPIWFGSVYGGEENADKEAGKYIAERDLRGIRGGVALTVTPQLNVTGSLRFENSDYAVGQPFPPFPAARDDDRISVGVAFQWLLDRHWSVRGELSHARNDSNIQLYEYDRTQAMIALRYEVH